MSLHRNSSRTVRVVFEQKGRTYCEKQRNGEAGAEATGVGEVAVRGLYA